MFIVHKASQVSKRHLRSLLDDLRGHVDALLLSEGDIDGLQMVMDAGFEQVTEVWPSMAEADMQRAVSFASAFIYLQSAPRTGGRLHAWHEIANAVSAVKALTDVPVCCGFGIRTPEHVRQFARLTGCDGVIVGSEILRRLESCSDERLPECFRAIERYLHAMVTSAISEPEELIPPC
jgi:tryptophan synthase alpha subunit